MLKDIRVPKLCLFLLGIILPCASAYYGGDYYNSLFRPLSADFKTKVETLGAVLKRHVQRLRATENGQVELVFLVDSSSSVGSENFFEELRFVRKLLADFTVDVNKTRVSVITFSSRGKVIRRVDHLSYPSAEKHKCRLLGDELPRVNYIGGGTYTLGAFLEAKSVLKASRPNATKAIFLITDGFSNGGDPRPEAKQLRGLGVKIFTFGIRNGNFRELYDMASQPKNETCYILDSFEEFEALARRALHEDLHTGSFVDQPRGRCRSLCKEGTGCCHSDATCTCGTHTGKYECQCKAGFYGQGIGKYGCKPCPPGTYKNVTGPGDVSTCLPCPDENQTTGSGTATIADCSCKKGFVNMNTSECAAFTCPALDRPDNGYFVNNKCNNVYNAACGLRCKPGYELQGSSLRICQENGSWSGLDTKCVMKTCPPLPTPKAGHMICSRDDFTYSTVCRFTCDTGYKLVGSRKRTCLAIAIWTGLTTRCKEITCQPLSQLKDGSVHPAVCTAGEVSFGTTCQMTCLPGYTMYGPHTMQCTPDGNWAPIMDKYNQCIDEKPPFLECPPDIAAEADDDDSMTEVSWSVPLSLDNSGFLPTMTMEPAVSPPAKFPIGQTKVTYTVEDFSKNVAKCSFTVTVKDTTPPTIDRCVSPKAVVSPDKYGNVTWEEPLFSDNSEQEVNVSRSHEPGWFPLGTTTVLYTASDQSGNNNTCTLEINVLPHPCEFPTPPVNGNRTCHETDEAVHCSISCHQGYAFAIPPAEDYYCAYDNTWHPKDKLPFPDCSEKKISNDVVQPATVKFKGKVPCREKKILHKIEKSFEKKVSLRVSDLCEENFICSVDDIETTCEEGNDFNKIHIGLGQQRSKRRRRRRRRASPYKKKLSNSKAIAGSLLTFSFKIEGRVVSTGNQTEDDRRQVAITENLKDILKALHKDAHAGRFNFNLGGKKMSFANMTFDPKTLTFVCPEGSVRIHGNTCINCPVGTFFNVIQKTCRSCGVGSYQPKEGSVSCLVCPGNSSTVLTNSRASSECRAQCLPGTFSANGLERCETCEVGFYQQKYAQVTCLTCPTNTTTRRRGSRGIDSCKERCPPGYVSKTGLKPCSPCPKGTYQHELGQSACFRCPHEALTPRTASTAISECEGDWDLQSDSPSRRGGQQQVLVNPCFDEPCLNGGVCKPKGFIFKCICSPGYSGIVCQTAVDQCESKPCLNNGTCENLGDDYLCRCPLGFGGKKCEVNNNECDSNPCLNSGTCIDGANSFQCNCPSGFQGATCEENINDCSGSPCRHGGSCIDDVSGYSCTCSPGYTGETCEIEIDECEDNPCVNGICNDEVNGFRCDCTSGYEGKRCEREIDECSPNPCLHGAKCEDQINAYTCHCPPEFTGVNCDSPLDKNYQLDFPTAGTDHVQIPIEQDLDVVTVSFWMKTDDTVNQGTPFSYAVPGLDNCLTLTDYDGFAINVNDEKVMTDEPTNDGIWHHIVVTWTANRGSWKLYIDGLLSDSGFDLSTGKAVPGGGVFVIGQEQDKVGGGFDPREAFIGSIAHLNVWDEELPLNTIDSMRTQCTEFYGNVIAWPDVRGGIRGSLKDASSTFCGDCPTPKKPDYGSVRYNSTAPGQWIEYTCIRGFQLAGFDTLQCLATGEWESEPPTCQKVTCGYPGSIKNGFIEGFNYDYDNRIRYQCSRGYKIVGQKTRYCNEYGEWEGDEPECLAITCVLPPISENTRISNPNKEYRPGKIVTFNCNTGYRLLTPHNAVQCQGDGTWDKSVPTCDALYCGEPPDILHGGPQSTPEQSFVGALIDYGCNFGYEFDEGSSPTISCQPTGSWPKVLPICSIVTCPEPPIVAHASSHGDSYEFLSLVEYLCDDGYEIHGEEAIECLEDEQWSETPSCDPVSCGEPDELSNGEITGDDYTLNSAINYECNTGYKLKGGKRRHCLANSTWSGANPVCKPLVCGKPSRLDNGRVEAAAITYGSVARFSCNGGYDINGASEMLCQEDGTWSVSPPTCDPVECTPLGDIENGFFKVSGRLNYGQTVTYFCSDGFELEGESTLTCDSSGRWSSDEPSCVSVECPSPEQIPNGNVNILGLTYTSKVEYTCAEGYELQGQSVRTCQADRSWTNEVPHCKPLKCSAPETISNGAVDYKDLSLGSVVRYLCNPGYEREGVEVRRCQSDLAWSDSAPSCNPIQCPPLQIIPYGSINSTEVTFRTIVSYECVPGYLIKGEAIRICSESKTWSGSEPTCSPVECDEPSTVTSNGRVHGTNYSFGAVISYECDKGYNLVGSQNRTCQANGEWNVPIPICEIVECPRARLTNGRTSTFKRTFNTEVEFTCKNGYRLEGPSTRTCQASGTWSGESPVCVKVVCPAPSPIPNGRVTRSLNRLSITYECLKGFQLNGPNKRVCQNDGTWSLTEPSCDTIACEDLSSTTFENGRVIITTLTFGSYAGFECYDGYDLVGERRRKCSDSGEWSGEMPVCELISCGRPGAFLNGVINGSEFTFSSTLLYSCNRGFELKGASERRCGPEGLWEPGTPRCQSIVCPDLSGVDYGRTILQSNTLDGTVRYQCLPGYVLRGNIERTCLETGTWSGTDPRCVMLECPTPDAILNGQVVGDSYGLGRSIQYRCNEGYRLVGSGFLQCLPTQFWSGIAPVCEKVRCPPPATPVNGIVEGDDFTYDEMVIYNCMDGYEITGETIGICQADGAWSIDTPSCDPIPCGLPPAFSHASPNLQNGTVYGSSVSIVCEVGYTPVGESQILCQEDGTWSTPSFHCEIVSCPEPLPNPHVIIDGNFTYGSSLNFKCKTGYELVGVDSTCRCKADGTWSNPFPECMIITCSDPEPFDHGIISESNYTYQSELVYTCDKGFELIGEERRICQDDKTWSGQHPMCILISCPSPILTIPNGRLIYPKPAYSYNDEAVYACNDGYELIGNNKIRCMADTSWNSKPPSCTKILCPQPGTVENGNLEATDEVITYTCDDGYELMGSNQRRCLDTGLWDTIAPLCLPVHCASPEPVNHGQVEGRDYTYGQTIRYTCSEGFMLVGDAVRECGASGEWTNESPLCDRKMCSIPRPPQHGSVSGSSYYFEDRIVYTCDFGYDLVGVREHVCQSDGIWSSLTPTCSRKVCSSPPNVSNAEFTASDSGVYHIGISVTYTCSPGYTLEGDSTIRCQEDTSWSATAPECRIVTCSRIGNIENGIVTGRLFTYKSIVLFECAYGYSLVGADVLNCQDDGAWSSEIPVCQLMQCTSPPPVAHGSFNMLNGDEPGSTFQYEDQISYYCEPGYNLVGNVLRRCDGTGTWTDRSPICVPINCGRPPPVRHSRVTGNNFQFGNNVTYECNTGYAISGRNTLECGTVGAWEGSLPVCEKIECGHPNVFDHVSVTVEYEGTTQIAVYKCNSGYVLQGSPRAECDMGTWVYSEDLDCVPVDCRQPPRVSKTTLAFTETTLFSTASYSCITGHTLTSGESEITCREDGSWSTNLGQLPVCTKVLCGQPQTDVPFEGTDFYFGGTIFFTCAPGHDLIGSSSSTCMESGFWSNLFPNCEKISCGEPDDSVDFIGSNFTFESILTYQCPYGYDMTGEAEITCQADGSWSGDAPRCSKTSCGRPPAGPTFSGSENTYGATVVYSCPIGHNMIGNAEIACQANGTWSGYAPICEKISCGEPPDTTLFTGTDYSYGGTVRYICPEGYEMIGDSELTCEERGEWVGVAPICEIVDCGRPQTDVSYEGDEFTYGSSLNFFCESGYQLVGDIESSCREDGSWSTKDQICIKVNCGIPSTDALFRGSDFSYGGRVSYYCRDGYSLSGEDEIICQADGTWSAAGQTCVPVDCGEVHIPENAVLVSGDPIAGTFYDNAIVFRCETGFSLNGQSTLTCLASGDWSSPLPTCIIEFSNLCDLAVDREHTRPIPSGYMIGDSVIVECRPGYEADGDMASACVEGGTWSMPEGHCRRVAAFCQARVDLANTAEIRPGFLVGDSATVECERGYTSNGDMSSICLDGGEWSTPSGHCSKVYCGRPKVQDMVNVMLIGRSYFYGDHVMFMCRPGLTPVRVPPKLTCSDTGEWDGQAGCQVQCKFECLNGGRCVGLNKCKCMSGYGGIRCETPICILPCLNGGSCAAPYRCNCPPGYTGSRCQRAICSKNCENGGRCLHPNRCQCPRAFLPPFCDKRRQQNVNIGYIG